MILVESLKRNAKSKFWNISTPKLLKKLWYEKTINFATNQPNVFYKGDGGLGGCTIDKDSNLKLGSIQTNTPSKLNLQQRQFLTVPF